MQPANWYTPSYRGACIANAAAAGAAWPAAWNVTSDARAALRLDQGTWASDEGRQQRLLLADIFGNPFRAVCIERVWLRWNDCTVPKIAQGIYDDRRFRDLPILADALLDAGCDDEALMLHLRSPGPHVRGCWALDLVLGKS
jgi:hypothetical protein